MTVSAWVRATGGWATGWQAFVSKRGEFNQGWQLRRKESTDAICFTVHGTTGDDDAAAADTTLGSDGLWHHVVGVYDGSRRKTYLDGVLYQNIADTGSIPTTNDPVAIGGRIDGGTRGRIHKGLIDDVRIYSRALSASEIRLLAHPAESATKLVEPARAAEAAAEASSGSPGALAEFDKCIAKRDYEGARRGAERAAGDKANAGIADTLRAAARVAREIEARRKAIRGAVRSLAGREIDLLTSRGKLAGKVAEVTDEAVVLTVKKKFRGMGTIETSVNVKWAELAPGQEDELARKGGWKGEGADAAVARAYVARGRSDAQAVGAALAEAGDHPLALHLGTRVVGEQDNATYDRSMTRARSLMRQRSWKKATASLNKVLALKPDDAEAMRLLAEARSKLPPDPTLTLNLGGGVTMEMVYIKPGVFMMGGTEDPKINQQGIEKPKHEVAITRGFYIGRYEVTRGQFAAFVKATSYKTDAERGGLASARHPDGMWRDTAGVNWLDPKFFTQTDDRPVMAVSWNDAKAFCGWAAAKTRREVRLPAEAEWEFACRAGSTTRYCFGDHDGGLGEFAWCRDNSGMQTHPVGQKKPNALGLYDMHGNVWERVADWYDAGYYAKSPRENPAGPDSGRDRLRRGGGWYGNGDRCRSATRLRGAPSQRNTDGGFRACVSSAPRVSASARAAYDKTIARARESLSNWQNGNVTPDGLLMEGTKTSGQFGSFRLHMEFRLPYKPTTAPSSQDRGNSGVYTFNRYEMQLLDSFGLHFNHIDRDNKRSDKWKDVFQEHLGFWPKSDRTQWCGCFYDFNTPKVNMCYPPLAWQTYDIMFTAPKFKDDRRVASARFTIFHNGYKVHEDVVLPKGTGGGGKGPEGARECIFLQRYRKNAVRFRNIWIVETER